MQTPFFPAFRPQLAACRHRATHKLRRASLVELEAYMASIFPPQLLSQADEGSNSRERIFTLRLTLQCFLYQVFNPGSSCREIVRHVQALMRTVFDASLDEGTSAYCQARKRLPITTLKQLLQVSSQAADRRAGSGGLIHGRPVKVVDCSSAKAPDTPANQKRFPQPSEQKPGCGFPVIRLLVLYSLNSGAVLNVIMSNLHKHEVRLLRQLRKDLNQGDILLGDRAYGNFTTLATLPARGVDVVARLNAMRKVDFRTGQRLGKNDALFLWKRNPQGSALFTPEQWLKLPETIQVRILRFRGIIRGRSRRITLVTTLLDPKLYPAEQLAGLYARRWRLELCLRDLKTTMKMELLRCKTPAMVRKEIMAYILAHNIIRCLMADAVACYEGDLERISFRGTIDAFRQYTAAISAARNKSLRDQLWLDLLANLARDKVPLRPGRQEPRALKQRPKNFGWLTKPRQQYKTIAHRNRYWTAKGRDYRRLN